MPRIAFIGAGSTVFTRNLIGDVLAFPAVQTYRGGEKVRWTGAPSSDTPAPRVTLTAPPAGAAALVGKTASLFR